MPQAGRTVDRQADVSRVVGAQVWLGQLADVNPGGGHVGGCWQIPVCARTSGRACCPGHPPAPQTTGRARNDRLSNTKSMRDSPGPGAPLRSTNRLPVPLSPRSASRCCGVRRCSRSPCRHAGSDREKPGDLPGRNCRPPDRGHQLSVPRLGSTTARFGGSMLATSMSRSFNQAGSIRKRPSSSTRTLIHGDAGVVPVVGCHLG